MASQELVNSTQKSQENITSRKNSVDTYLEQRLQSQIVTPIDVRSERDNSIFAVSNLLKGHPNNANYMIQCDGAKMILIEILRIQDTKSSLSKEIIELLLGCVKQLTDQKKMLQDFLSFSTENLNLLPACLEKCFEISDSWHTCTSEILLFKKLFIEGERNYEGEDPNIRMSRLAAQERKMKRLDTEQILNIDYKNIEKIKILEKLEEKEDKSFVMAPMCKLRNHCYNIATSCLAACFSQGFLLEQCKLIERIIMDLSENEKNDFIFQNLIGILRTFKKDKQAIQVLFQKYSTQLIELIRSMEDTPNKRNSLMKTMVYLVLRAPEELCSLDPKIMGNFFALAIEIDDDEVKENILWLQSALVEINCSEEQNQKAIELCTEFKSAQIYLKSLASENEIIVLQAIKGLKSLAAIPSFKAIILIDIGDELFQSLAQILASRLQKFTKCPLEIEVELIGFLAQITESSAASKDPLTIAAKRRAVQQGFMEHFLVRTSDIEYQVVQDIDILNENCAKLNNLDLMQINSGDNKVNSSGPGSARQRAALNSIEIEDLAQGGDFDPCSVLPDFDRVEREDGMNHLVENTMRLAANVTELAETHDQLVHGRGQVLMQTCALLQNMVSQCIEVESEQVDMLQYSIGNREICDSLTKIVLNLCLSTNPTSQPGGQSIQDHCVDNSIGNLMVHVCRSLIDYELHSNLYRAMCLLAVSPNQQNRTHFVESDCLTEVQQAAENNRFFRVRRTCSKAIEQFGSELFELNEKIQRKRRKANKKRNGNGNNVQLQDGNLVNIQHQ